ncbi:hypothetical protein [Actinomadura barringtoniae]|nr:hypothetical protein [Actinomadura barringtoniae]
MTALQVASQLPDIATLRDVCRPMRNGSGDEYSIVFSKANRLL